VAEYSKNDVCNDILQDAGGSESQATCIQHDSARRQMSHHLSDIIKSWELLRIQLVHRLSDANLHHLRHQN
jgi:hypothetical protein